MHELGALQGPETDADGDDNRGVGDDDGIRPPIEEALLETHEHPLGDLEDYNQLIHN